MIKHVVCYKLKNNSSEVRNKTKDVLMSMIGKVNHFESIEVGLDELNSPRSYDIVLIMTFKDMNEYELYQNDPYHVQVVKKHMHSVRETSVSVDYEY